MAITIKHTKTDTIADWTQADLDAQIAAGNYPVGTLISDIVLPSDWNDNHTFSGVAASGANSDITSLSGITGGISTPDYLQLDTTAAASIALGKLRWNADNATAAFGIIDGTTEVNIGEQMYAYVTNAESVTITAGQAVYLYQATGNRASVKLAYNLGDATSAKTLGLVTQDIAAGATGFVTTQGVLAKINTSAFAEGDTLYLGATAGSLTATKPQAPNHFVYIGVVERANSGNGQIYVRPQNGYELDEIHDVQINSPANGQTIIYDASTSLWKNANLTAGTGISITNGASSITITNSSPNTYDPTNVAITGGTINNTSIGATTASTGKFTSVTTPSVTATTTDLTLSAISTGAVKFNTLNGEQLRVIDNGSTAARYLVASGSSSSSNPNLGSSAGPLVLYGGANQGILFYSNAYAQQQFAITHTASAVNYVQVTGAATGNRPAISSQGSDTNIGLSFDVKGGPNIFFRSYGGVNNQLKIAGTNASVNNHVISGGAATIAPSLSVEGTDTNISMAFQPKGTGAIDLAAGSSGVNISNGGTVTALTRTAGGSAYTSFPSVAITAPTTAGGVQATASVTRMFNSNATVSNGGTGYTVGDTLTVVGGTPTSSAATYTVATVSAGVITSVTFVTAQAYSVLPTNPVSVTGGTGSGATLNLTWALDVNGLSITNAGSGYIEQPTVSFSGGGGSGAAAYAVVGGNSTIKGIGITSGASITFSTPAGDVLKIADAGTTTTNFLYAGTGVTPFITSQGTNAALALSSNGSGTLWLRTNGAGTNQMAVTHTASAVNYVQVTGAATTSFPIISAQGSDTNISMQLYAKGTGAINFWTNNGGSRQLQVAHTAGTIANYATITGNVAGSAPVFSVAGTDTNIDLALTPKGTGRVKFGTYTATVTAVAGYIEILDAGGTLRKLAVLT